MAEHLSSLSPTQALLRRGLEFLPKEGLTNFNDYLQRNPYFLALDEKRKEFYQDLKGKLPQSARGYYPGSGSDPIPAAVFGSSIIYGSLESEYFDWLRKGNYHRSFRYAGYFNSHGLIPNIQAFYGDVTRSPLKDKTMQFVVANCWPLINNRKTIREILRILTKDGIFIVEQQDVIVDQNGKHEGVDENTVAFILRAGFKPRQMDKYMDPLGVAYSRAATVQEEIQLGLRADIELSAEEKSRPGEGSFKTAITRQEYIERISKGLPAHIHAHEIRVFEKG